MQAILLALISYLCWGTGDIFGTQLSRKLGGVQTAFWFFLLLIPFYVVICLMFPGGIENLTLSVFVLSFVLGIIAAASMITFYESLRVGSSSLVATISAAFPAVVVPLSIVFLKEEITLTQMLAIAIILSGVLFSSLDFKEVMSRNIKLGNGIFLAVITMILWGIYWTFIKIPIEQIGWAWPNLLVLPAFVIVFIYMKLKKMTIDSKLAFSQPKSLVLSPFLLGTGAVAFSIALSQGANVAIITPIASSYPTLYAVLSYFVFKDPLKIREIIGIFITLMGIILISATSV